MLFTIRQRKILELLWMVRDFITVKDIADEVAFSEKTVRGDLNFIGQTIGYHNFGKLIAKTNKGFYLDVNRAAYDKISASFSDNNIDHRIQNRLSRILVTLLVQPETSLQELADCAFLDKSALKKYLAEAEQWLARFAIMLEKTGSSYTVRASEYQLRKAYWHLFTDLKGRVINGGVFNAHDENPTYSLDNSDYLALKTLFRKNLAYVEAIAQSIDRIEKNFAINYTYDGYVWLIFNLLLVLSRHHAVPESTVILPVTICDNLGQCVEQEMATFLGQQLQILTGLPWSNAEHRYLTACLLTSELNEIKEESIKDTLFSSPPEIVKVTQTLIQSLSSIVSSDLVRDKHLLLRLMLLIRPMIYRLTFDMNRTETESIRLLVRQVKLSYLDLFLEVEFFNSLYEQRYGISFSDHETGFITLCIKNAQSLSLKKIRVAIVCNYGIGISQFMAQKIKRAITQVDIVDILSVRELHRLDNNFCDLVVTTVPLNRPKDTTIQVNDVLLPYDLSLIKNAVKQMQKNQMLESVLSHGEYQKDAFRKYLPPEMTFIFSGMTHKESVFAGICQRAAALGYTSTDYLHSILEREKVSSTEIAAGVVLSHGDPLLVQRNFISLTRLTTPVDWEGGGCSDMIFVVAFKKAADGKIDSSIAGFYAKLVLLVENDAAMKLLRCCETEQELYQHLISMLCGETNE
ncbi:PTS sugar transporter subunit IIA [Acerihabitans sp. TG2]|uniref:BglG family transcription antiterminator n=1 Tax=Acerihabitans sp. TG2 TaxID=3096008 RepID=UPI002B22A8B9|nr:PTS sugar transporter subunit IIA [Acerihabitans sp. TG2]MEA9390273.1 PTS sugar transporter subunit IIA [Acerihabitans sp. TG2]